MPNTSSLLQPHYDFLKSFKFTNKFKLASNVGYVGLYSPTYNSGQVESMGADSVDFFSIRANTLNFRKDIQGYRALAVLLVIASHFGVPGFSAGFIGVDLFFVISGYLITSLIVSEKLSTGNFNYLAFYARRCRRLLPGLVCMLLVAYVLCGFFYAPRDQMSQAINGMAASLWVSNIQLAFAVSSYFEPDAQNNLFLHTWSLGVEEQFYIIWPLLLMGLLSAGLKSQLPNKKIFGVIAFIAFLSFCSSIWLSYHHPIQAYYLTPSRMWQFMLGALVFYVQTELVKENKKLNVINRNVSYGGLACIVISLLFLRSDLMYPGYQALVPSFGMALLLMGGADRSSYFTRLLELPTFQWIGDRSYSLYLWHWPIWLIICSFQSRISAKVILISLLVTFCVASILYKFIEKPIRNNRFGLGHKLTLSLSIISVLLVSFFGAVWFDKAEKWSVTSEVLAVGKYTSDLPIIYKMDCDTDIYSVEIKPCSFGRKENLTTVALWGDSIGAQWFPALFNLYDQDQYRIDVFIKSACSIVNAAKFYAKIGREYTECNEWRTRVLGRMKLNPPDILFIGSGLDSFTEQEWKLGVHSILNTFSQTKTKIYLLRATPRLLNDPIQCLTRQIWLSKFIPINDLCHEVQEGSIEQSELTAVWMREVAATYKNVKVIDLNQSICPDQLCILRDNGLVTFRDRQHLTATYVKSLSNLLAEKINEN